MIFHFGIETLQKNDHEESNHVTLFVLIMLIFYSTLFTILLCLDSTLGAESFACPKKRGIFYNNFRRESWSLGAYFAEKLSRKPKKSFLG